MAINYLNSINLNQNELIKGRIENQASDALAGTGVEGQIYYNTTEDVLKVWADGAWVEVGGGVITLTAGTYLTDTGTAEDPIINHDNTSRTDTTSTDAPTYGGTFEAVTSVTTNATGHVTAIDVSTVTIPASDDTKYDLSTASTGTAIRLTGSDSTTDDVTISGTTNEITVSRQSATELRVGLPDDVTINNDLTVGNDLTVQAYATFNGGLEVSANNTIDAGGNKIENLADPTSQQDAATKQYVDQAVTGALSYQGAYNASTNVPDLTTSPNSIKKGLTYTVTADGTFFGEQLRVGDVLIAEIDNPTDLNAWTTVQNNVDLADLTTVGIGNVNAGEAIDVSYASGTATVSVEDSTASNKGAVIVAGGTGISVAYSSGTATVTNTNTNSSNTYAETITDTDLTIDHNLGTKDVIVQLYDITTDETVYADVERISNSRIGVTFASTPVNSVRVLVQKIG